eukprot:1160472-Pelagomonas_calceolata.AAC.3
MAKFFNRHCASLATTQGAAEHTELGHPSASESSSKQLSSSVDTSNQQTRKQVTNKRPVRTTQGCSIKPSSSACNRGQSKEEIAGDHEQQQQQQLCSDIEMPLPQLQDPQQQQQQQQQAGAAGSPPSARVSPPAAAAAAAAAELAATAAAAAPDNQSPTLPAKRTNDDGGHARALAVTEGCTIDGGAAIVQERAVPCLHVLHCIQAPASRSSRCTTACATNFPLQCGAQSTPPISHAHCLSSAGSTPCVSLHTACPAAHSRPPCKEHSHLYIACATAHSRPPCKEHSLLHTACPTAHSRPP